MPPARCRQNSVIPTLRQMTASESLGYGDLVNLPSQPETSDRVQELRRRVETASDLFFSDRSTARSMAESALAENISDDKIVAAQAHRVLARCSFATSASNEAIEHADLAVAAAESSRDRAVLGQALLTRIAMAAGAGRHHEALADADRAESLLDSDQLVRLAIQRGSVLAMGLSNIDDAIAVLDRAMLEHPTMGQLEEAVLRMNRGSLLRRRGDLERADVDLERSHALYAELGHHEAAAEALLHRALVAARRGDHPTVFEIHQTVLRDDMLARSDPRLALDVSECLMIAGLHREAERYATFAIERTSDEVSEHALETGLHAARVQLLAGHHERAIETSDHVRRRAQDLGNRTLEYLADLLILTAKGLPGSADVERVSGLADRLDEAGLRDDALDARIMAAHRAIGLGQNQLALSIIAPAVEPTSAIRGRHALGRARIRHARALQLVALGRPGAARQQLAFALRDVEQTRSATEASDLRAAASDRAPHIAALGLRLAIEARVPRSTLEWAERARAASLRLAGRPSVEHDELRDQLDELRLLDGRDTIAVDRLERQISRRARSGRSSAPAASSRSAGDLCRIVGPNRTLIEFIELDGQLSACVIDRARASVVDLRVGVDDLEETVGKLLFGLRRMSTRLGSAAEAASLMVAELARRLDRQLFSRLGLAGSEIIIVPTGPLHHLPWAVLPTLSERPFVVAPSAHVWCDATGRQHSGEGAVIATGPGLPEAEGEAREIMQIWGNAAQLRLRATSSAARDSLPGSSIAHVVCHGRFRIDSPQFSALELSDGPFTVFDLEGIGDLPSLVVLSACNLGSVDVKVGDDLLGFPAALFARGVNTLVAALLPVEDAATRALMVHLHRQLAAGTTPAQALRDARRAVGGLGPSHAAAAASFQCFGAG